MGVSPNSLDQVLWRIAELGHRYADPAFASARRRIWAELETAVAEAKALAETTAPPVVVADADVDDEVTKELEDALVRAEADQEAAEAARRDAEWRCEAAEAARREAEARCEAMASAVAQEAETVARLQAEQKDTRGLVARQKSALAQAESELEVAQTAVASAQAAQREAEAERDAVRGALAAEAAARQKAETERNAAREAFALATAAWREAEAERDAVREALVALEEAAGFGDLEALAAEVEAVDGAEVVVTPAPEEEPDPMVLAAVGSPRTSLTMAPETAFGPSGVQYLYVGATLAGLLPDDLTPLLVEGAFVVRREGRISALLAIPCDAADESVPSPEWEEQARRLRDRDLRVGWAEEAA